MTMQGKQSRRNLVALSFVVVGAILFLLSITGFLTVGWNFVLRLAAIVLGLGGLFYIFILLGRKDRA